MNLPVHELAALGAAASWALTGLISAAPAAYLGAPAFNRARQVFVTGLLACYALVTGVWRELDLANAGPLRASRASSASSLGDTPPVRQRSTGSGRVAPASCSR